MVGHGRLVLHHGSREGIRGRINHASRWTNAFSDFGQGFHMVPDEKDAMFYSIGGSNPTSYQLEMDLDGLSVLHVDGLAWVLLVACNRGWIAERDGKSLYDFVSGISDGCDLIVGPTADDRTHDAINWFLDNSLSVDGVTTCLKGMNLPLQYVAKSDKADARITIQSIWKLSFAQCDSLRSAAVVERAEIARLTEKVRKDNRKSEGGLFFSDVLDMPQDRLARILTEGGLRSEDAA